jgi:hypothetical protein
MLPVIGADHFLEEIEKVLPLGIVHTPIGEYPLEPLRQSLSRPTEDGLWVSVDPVRQEFGLTRGNVAVHDHALHQAKHFVNRSVSPARRVEPRIHRLSMKV